MARMTVLHLSHNSISQFYHPTLPLHHCKLKGKALTTKEHEDGHSSFRGSMTPTLRQDTAHMPSRSSTKV